MMWEIVLSLQLVINWVQPRSGTKLTWDTADVLVEIYTPWDQFTLYYPIRMQDAGVTSMKQWVNIM